LTLNDTVTELSKYWNTAEFKKALNEFLAVNSNICTMPWMNVFFDVPAKGSNTAPLSSTPLTVSKGVGKIFYLNGEIICKIENEEACRYIEEAINNGVGSATLLENGLVYVVGLEKYHPYGAFDDKWTQIF
jgi:hypothetical protein